MYRLSSTSRCTQPSFKTPRVQAQAVRDLRVRGQRTQGENARLTDDLEVRFQAYDVDGNGAIDREEFARVAESAGNGSVFVMFHWLADAEVDALFDQYAIGEDEKVITLDSFKRLAQDGVLLEGRLSEYKELFESCPSFSEDGGRFGSIQKTCVTDLTGRLEHPLTIEEAETLVDSFCDGRECGLEANRLTFEEFLHLFRDKLLDLQQITEYMKLEAVPVPEYSASEVEQAEKNLPELVNGVYKIESSEQFDALSKLNSDKSVVLLSGLSWCRPCKGLTRPIEKMAVHYKDGAVFAKMMGDTSDNTKRFFKDKLKVKATPHISIHRSGVQAYTRTGANKSKFEDSVRRFYNVGKYSLPRKVLYPPIPKPNPPSGVV